MSNLEMVMTDSEEEEDEEMIFLIFPALYKLSKKIRTPMNTSVLTGPMYIRELLDGHPTRCYDDLRMESHIFQELCDDLRSRKLLENSRGVSVEERLGMLMYMLSRNASYRTLTDRFQRSPETVHRHMNGSINAIMSLAYDLIKLPSTNPHIKISSSPLYWPYFENCIGAIDGTHIPMTVNENEAAPYRNRKGTLSQNVMVACDFDLSFTYASSGWEGSVSDAGVLNSAIQSGFRVPEGKYYLVDGGYANTPKFLAPYRNVRYHLKEQARGNCRPRDYKELFNLRHARLRNIIERIIGILKMRFPILKVATHYPIDTQVKIPLVAMVLYNIIRSQRGDEEWLKTQKMHIDPSKYVDVPTGDMTLRDDSTPSESRRKLGNALRDEIAKKIVYKEGKLKKEYKVVKSIVNRSGISWNSTSCMINTTPEKWEEIVEEDPKFRRLHGKEFPLFDALDLLYEGNIAQGKHCVTSSQPPHITSRKCQSDERQSTRNVAPKISAMTSQRFSEDEGQNRFSEVERMSASGRSLSYQSQNDDELNP